MTRAALVFAVLCAALTASAGAQPLRAGAARVDITPPLGGAMYGYGARQGVSAGVHDPLYARAVVLSAGGETVALVALDMGSVRRGSVERVRAAVLESVPVDVLLLMASHSHSTAVYSEHPTAENPWYRLTEAGIVRAVESAYGALTPARLRAGTGEADLCHNRRALQDDGSVEMLWENRAGVATSPVDRTVGVLALDGEGGEAIATLVNFACHPVILGPDNLELSADYPGVMGRRIEETAGGVALFIPGAAGDINPFWDKTPLGEGAFDQVEKAGSALAEAALDARRSAASVSVETIRHSTRELELEARWDFDSAELRQRFDAAGAGQYFDYYRERYLAERRTEVSAVLLGDSVGLATFPGEFFVEHGLRLKAQSHLPHTFFVGYTNGELGYFPTIRAAGQGGYGATEGTVVAVGAGERLVDGALIALLELSRRLSDAPDF
ncbi:MAG: neutral/alkaline non-lysosomal ceramidase N-terminal domain-containing protein [Acidobacteriota bacterium]